tara:strand:- start:35 stop:565 length:531 start_codon:yes stop_codon:yes gene_type:complete
MSTTLFYFDGQPIGQTEFIKKLFNTITLPQFFENEEELQKIWSSPITRQKLLKKLEQEGFTKDDLKSIQKLIVADDSDIYDVLQYVAFQKQPVSRKDRVVSAERDIYENVSDNEREFIDFILSRYVDGGGEELEIDRLSKHIELKYLSMVDGQKVLGSPQNIKEIFVNFQKYLYQR